MIKFRQKIYSEEEEKEGGVLAPLSIIGGGAAIGAGLSKLSYSKRLKEQVPYYESVARSLNRVGVEKANKVKDSWLGFGKYLRKDKIRKINEETSHNVENVMRKARKTSRKSGWEKTKGKGLIGIGAALAGYGTYRLMKKDRKKSED
jgi:hypothetical protein